MEPYPPEPGAAPPLPRRAPAAPVAPVLQTGLNFAVGMALFSYLGYRLDGWTGGRGGWTLAGVALGLRYGAYEVWRAVRLLQGPPPNGEPPRGPERNDGTP